MDEWIPPAIRDSRWFMRPAYMFAYRRFDVREMMDFKLNYYGWTPERRADFYRGLRSISRARATDLNSACIERILGLMPESGARIADFGCGGGYLLERLAERYPGNHYVGFDFKTPTQAPSSPVRYECVDLESIEPAEQAFDIVLCSHVLEHLIDYRRVMRVLARSAAQPRSRSGNSPSGLSGCSNQGLRQVLHGTLVQLVVCNVVRLRQVFVEALPSLEVFLRTRAELEEYAAIAFVEVAQDFQPLRV